MTPAEWARVKEVVADALERPETERVAFLEAACGPDTRLRAEVERLLASEESGSLESPVGGALSPAPELAAGQVLGHFRIESRIGQGGMGAVYRAWDEKLQRTVAIKVLADGRLSNQASRQRFLREARAASALNHPGIVTIHEVASDDGFDFIAMELVEGESLDRRIPKKGLPLKQALDYAVQIAAALTKAHATGIIHRDLKPSNVMVTPEGQVKLLDFGLARRVHTGDGSGSTMTRAGEIMGTPAYMSPEQAEGKPLDARSDIFSFGAVLYEMLTGGRAFQGDSTMSILSAVLQTEPRPLSEDLPSDLRKIVSRCLRKDPERRFQFIKDVLVELSELREESDSAPLAAIPKERSFVWRRRWLAVIFAVPLLGAGWFLWQRYGSDSAPPRLVQLTAYPGSEMSPTFSPDGNQVAFAWGGEKNDNYDIYVKMVGETNALRLTTNPAFDGYPAWSRDGKRIAFWRTVKGATAIYLVSPLGGAEQKLADIPGGGQMSWSADGKWIAVGSSSAGIRLVSVENGQSRPLSNRQAPGNYTKPAYSPDGRRLAYAACTGAWSCDVYIQDLDDRGAPKGEPTRATNRESSIGGITWDRDGDSIIYVESIITGRVPYLWRAWANRAERLEVAGSKALYPSVSAQGSRLAFSRLHSNQDIWRYRPGVGQEPLITSTLEDRNPQLSPDGKRIAFESLQSGEAVEIWVSNLDGSNQVQLTNRLGRQQGTPRWSPDGRWIAFDSLGADGRVDVWVVDAGGGQPRRITSFPTDEACPSWSRDGNWIYFRSDRSGRREIWRAKVAGGAAEQVTRNGGFIAFESTDGKTLFYTKAQDSPIFATPVNGGPERQIVDYSVLRALAVVDEGIYYIGRRGEDGRNPLQLYEFSAGKSREIVRLDRVTQYGITVTPDRKTFLFSREMSSGADLMLVENFR